MIETTLTLEELSNRAQVTFKSHFGRPASLVVAAPGRVNLIGEHTDYNDGFVLPMAIDRYTVLACDVASDATRPFANLFSATLGEAAPIPLAGHPPGALPEWAKYVRGVFDAAADTPIGTPPPFDAVIDSTVPLGGGLSSSAALEVATATLLEELTGITIDPMEKALLCQRAEHEGAGMPCGIMDQFSSVLCELGHLMLLDCRSRETRMVPLADPSVTVLIINSNVKHELTGGEYAERRQQCEAAAKTLCLSSLRDATLDGLERHRHELDDVHHRRARHVISEIARTAAAADAITFGDWSTVGELMFASHNSLRDDFEVSCEELDVLVKLAADIGAAGGVIGSRMTGGGFGGCTVSLVRADRANDIATAICQKYQERTGIEPTAFVTPPSQGARVMPSVARLSES